MPGLAVDHVQRQCEACGSTYEEDPDEAPGAGAASDHRAAVDPATATGRELLTAALAAQLAGTETRGGAS